jgi:hypothetical protein
MMRSSEVEATRSALIATALLFGSFAFAYNVVVVLHEIGHVVGAWLTGGQTHSLVVHPFSTSSVEVNPDPRPLVTHIAGILAPPLVGLALFRGLRPFLSPALLPLLLVPSIAWASSGLYLLVGAALQAGDALVLMQQGVPRTLLFAAGVACVPVSAHLAQRLFPLLGLDRGSPPARRVVVLGGGVGTYLLAIVAWQLARAPSSVEVWSALAGGGAALLALIGWWAPRSLPREREGVSSTPPLSWPAAASAVAQAGLVISAELLWI